MLRALCVTMIGLVLPAGYARADDPPGLSANAALKHWQAFAQLPRFTEAEEHKLNAEFLNMPLDAHAREIVAKADYALRMMHRAAALPRCEWSLDYEEGIELLLPHAQAGRLLSTLACLRARIRFENGQGAAATEDIVDAMTVGRHVSMDGTLITVMVNYAIEDRATDTLALYLPKLSADTIKSLKSRLGTLPQSGSPARGLVPFEEKAGLDWLIRKVKEQKDEANLKDFASSFLSRQGDSAEQRRERGRSFVAECGGTLEGVLKQAEETRAAYTRTAKLLELPLDQFEQEFQVEAGKQSGNPVFKILFPQVSNLRRRQARADVRRALLATALDIQLDGPGALKNHLDPVTNGPFELNSFDGGFELRSNFKMPDEKPLTLAVGQRGR